MKTHSLKYRVPPPFSSENARKAQCLAVAKRRATDEELRRDLAECIPAMSRKLRRAMVAALRIRQVEAFRLAAQREAEE